ncbi:MAG: ABC transporter permease, partial [Acidimicrobiia bacterium]|nr:ABC transporter permease [Acidimicrobiia bacterium]
RGDRREFAAGVRRTNLAVTTALSTGAVPPGDVAATIGDAASAAPLLGVGDIETESRQLNTATYFVAGLSIFFLFFIAGLGVTSMLEERREGTLFRLMAAPIRRRSIVLGKSLTSVVIGLVSMIVLVIASGIIMGAEWGPPLGVAMMVTSAVLAVVGVMTLVGGFAKTPEQAGNLQSIVAVTFGMLGGTFVPVAEGEGLMSSLRFVTPNGWFMRGLGDIASGDAMAALPSMGILLAMAAVTGGLGLALVRKVVHA